MAKAILAMPPPKKTDSKKPTPVQIEETVKPAIKPQAPPEPKDEDRIDFVNVKDLIKGMERQKPNKVDYQKETNGFHKKITDNGHDNCHEKKIDPESDKNEPDVIPQKTSEKTDEKTEKTIEKTDSTESTESSLSRSNSLINGVPVQVPKPMPRSSISEPGSTDEHSEAPKPKPRTTTVPGSGYKVHEVCGLKCRV